jgi:hypothetical protein
MSVFVILCGFDLQTKMLQSTYKIMFVAYRLEVKKHLGELP